MNCYLVRRATVVAALVLGLQTAIVDPALADEATVAIWKPHRLKFHYQSFTTYYTCDGLRGKVRQMLLGLGARDDIQIKLTGCAMGELQSSVRMELIFFTAAPPTEEHADKLPAAWDFVDLGDLPGGRSDRGDCELLEQFRKQVLPAFTIRGLVDNLRCTPHQPSVAPPVLKVDVLRMRPPADESP